jgi:hypothetical protein
MNSSHIDRLSHDSTGTSTPNALKGLESSIGVASGVQRAKSSLHTTGTFLQLVLQDPQGSSEENSLVNGDTCRSGN